MGKIWILLEFIYFDYWGCLMFYSKPTLLGYATLHTGTIEIRSTSMFIQ